MLRTAVLYSALELVVMFPIRGRDAVHVATALAIGLPAVVTSDQVFDQIPGLRRLDPTELAAQLDR